MVAGRIMSLPPITELIRQQQSHAGDATQYLPCSAFYKRVF